MLALAESPSQCHHSNQCCGYLPWNTLIHVRGHHLQILRTFLALFALCYAHRCRAQCGFPIFVSARTIVFESDLPSPPPLPPLSLFSLFYFGYFIFISPQLTRLVKRLLFLSLLKGLVTEYKCSNECMFSLEKDGMKKLLHFFTLARKLDWRSNDVQKISSH
jgi:hypothetical protein